MKIIIFINDLDSHQSMDLSSEKVVDHTVYKIVQTKIFSFILVNSGNGMCG